MFIFSGWRSLNRAKRCVGTTSELPNWRAPNAASGRGAKARGRGKKGILWKQSKLQLEIMVDLVPPLMI